MTMLEPNEIAEALASMPRSVLVHEILFETMPTGHLNGVKEARATTIGGEVVIHLNPSDPDQFLSRLKLPEYASAIEVVDFVAEIPGEKHEYGYGMRFGGTEIVSSKELMMMFFAGLGGSK